MSVAGSIELQVISKLITTQDKTEIHRLCEYGEEYYALLTPQIKFILNHVEKYGDTPDPFTFQAEFPTITLVPVSEPIDYLCKELQRNRERILLLETFNKVKMLGVDDASAAWEYIGLQYEMYQQLGSSQPFDIVHQAQERSRQVVEWSKQSRIPTGFKEVDDIMYGGLSTVEEMLVIISRTGNGKTWMATKMAESAQSHGFPVLFYSPEMQSSYIGTRFDTWRNHFENSRLFRGDYNEEYYNYVRKLEEEETPVYVLEDKDAPGGAVTTPYLKRLIKNLHIRELIIDGLSYVEDVRKGSSDSERYKHIANDIFKTSKELGCATVLMMQANRETQNCKDDKGEVFPTIANAEGSDHPCRIATQVIAMRQIFEKHVMDLRLEKARNANNQRPVLSYAWDINTGNMQFIPGDASGEDGLVPAASGAVIPTISPDMGVAIKPVGLQADTAMSVSDIDVDEEGLDFD